jgi:peroxiredoxin
VCGANFYEKDYPMLLPRTPVPDLDVALTTGERWKLSDEAGETFTMVVVYRGLHCPICKGYLRKLQSHLPKLDELGVKAIVLSSDGKDRAVEAQTEWGLEQLTMGYDFTVEEARKWGLYVSTANGESEPDLFVEPGLFVIRPDGTLYFASVQTMPFARPSFDEIVGGLDYVIKNDYPARGA